MDPSCARHAGTRVFPHDHLFYPFGTTIADHPHTVLQVILAATPLKSASITTTQNLLLITYVFANMAAMYALVWDICVTGARRCSRPSCSACRRTSRSTSWGTSISWRRGSCLHSRSHLRRAVRGSNAAAIAGGLVLAATAYIAYYLVVDRASSSTALRGYVAQLPADVIATDEGRDLYRMR
jgi:hypothetical protein